MSAMCKDKKFCAKQLQCSFLCSFTQPFRVSDGISRRRPPWKYSTATSHTKRMFQASQTW
eukprot:m.209482 g.209482  ORF g.209482 m.209482 type:complete len:60 (-) comp18984_c0_seq3:4-183(-)